MRRLLAVPAVALALGFVASPGAPASAAPGDPIILVFEADAGQKAYVKFGSAAHDPNADETVAVRVSWGDGDTDDYWTVGVRSHVYATAGTYTVTISPLTTALDALNGRDTGPWLTLFGMGRGDSVFLEDGAEEDLRTSTEYARLTRVTSLGDLGVTSLSGAFYNHVHLVEMTGDLPATVTDLRDTFRRSTMDQAIIGSWDVSRVTSMRSTFEASSFNRSLASWDVSNVTNMESMFEDATSFNQDLSTWTPTSVTTMENMFENAAAFNGNISTWKDRVGNVTDFSDFLKDATSFNQDLPDWDVSGADDLDSFFEDATAFNGSLARWTFSSTIGIDVSNFFEGAAAFDQPLSSWVTTNFDDVNDMFMDASSFDQDISGWDVSNVTNFNDMFKGASSFDQDISGWDVSSGTNLSSMFDGASSFDRSLGNWSLNASANLSRMLNGSGMSSSCYDATLTGWAALDSAVTGRSLGAVGRSFSPDAAAARAVLVDDRSWTIDGDGTVDVATGRCAGGGIGVAAPAAASSLALACLPTSPAPGAAVECTVSGGDPDSEILWRAGASAPFASSGVQLGPDGIGTFTFTVPAGVSGPVEVELVAWEVRTTLAVDGAGGMTGRPVPTIIRAGGGPADGMPVPASGLWLLGALALGGTAVLLRRAGRRSTAS